MERNSVELKSFFIDKLFPQQIKRHFVHIYNLSNKVVDHLKSLQPNVVMILQVHVKDIINSECNEP